MNYLQNLKLIANKHAWILIFALFAGASAAAIFLTNREASPEQRPSPIDLATENTEQNSSPLPQLSSEQDQPSESPSGNRDESHAVDSDNSDMATLGNSRTNDDSIPLPYVITDEEIVVLPSTGEVTDLAAESEKRFAQEDVDSAWALETENNIFDLFTNDETLSNFVLTNAECKSTECKITLNVSSEDQYYKAAIALTQALYEKENRVDITFNNNEQGDPTLYLKR